MSLNKKEVLHELKFIWVETTPENPVRDILHNELMNMLSKVMVDTKLLLELDDMLVSFYCIGEKNGFYNGVEVFRKLMEE